MARDVGDITVPLTAFGDTAVSELHPTIQFGAPYAYLHPAIVLTSTSGVAALVSGGNNLLTVLSSGAASWASLRSRRLHNYRPGQGCTVRFTAAFSTPRSDSVQIIGIGDDVDGFFFGYNGTSFGVLRRAGGVDTWTAQQNWNEDIFSGSTPMWQVHGHEKPKVRSEFDQSLHYALDPTKLQPYAIQYQWLGAGQVTYFVESRETGRFHPVHKVRYAGTANTPTVLNPSFPFYMRASTSSGGSVNVQTASVGVFNEGPTEPLGVRWATQVLTSAPATEKAALVIRNNDAIFGETNRVPVQLDMLSLLNLSASRGTVFNAYRNPTTVGGSWVELNSGSVMSTNTTPTSSSGGQLVLTAFAGPNGADNIDVRQMHLFLYPGESLAVTVLNPTTPTADSRVGLSWMELW